VHNSILQSVTQYYKRMSQTSFAPLQNRPSNPKTEVAPSQARANRGTFLLSPTVRYLNRCNFREIQFAPLTDLAGNGGEWRLSGVSGISVGDSTPEDIKARSGLLRAFMTGLLCLVVWLFVFQQCLAPYFPV